MLIIENIRPGSIAAELQIDTGSKLISINGTAIKDALDFVYHSDETLLEILIEDTIGEQVIYEIEKDSDDDLGFEFRQDKIRCCANKCIFCFIDQLPKGLRDSLYIKDEDYRLSFLDGNFITLTSVTERDLQRVIDYRLSPLYVSVHTTNEPLRKMMLGRKKLRPVMPTLKRLTDAGIEVHTQVVLCPGYNDGDELRRTIRELNELRPQLVSLGIVPVGISAHRQGLPELTPVNKIQAAEVIKSYGEQKQDRFRKDGGNGFVYLADEFYLLADLPIPDAGYYDDYYQYENGIGMLRSFLDDFHDNKNKLSGNKRRQPLRITIITGTLMAPVFRDELIPELNEALVNIELNLVLVRNRLLGESITVSGLISGEDIIRDYRDSGLESDLILLPPNCINIDGMTLDNHTPDSISRELNTQTKVGSYDLVTTLLACIIHKSQ
ncbi:MAG: DUF512 domain-containing protein [candidate division Zixibacteria bacterium]|nr:DUF512 domain-containing protein [candidate division Zixibacteria bacterium]